MYIGLVAFALLWLSTYLLAGSCRRSIQGVDPTTGRRIVIKDYTECGASCRFRVNRHRVADAFRVCRRAQWAGIVAGVVAMALFAWRFWVVRR